MFREVEVKSDLTPDSTPKRITTWIQALRLKDKKPLEAIQIIKQSLPFYIRNELISPLYLLLDIIEDNKTNPEVVKEANAILSRYNYPQPGFLEHSSKLWIATPSDILLAIDLELQTLPFLKYDTRFTLEYQQRIILQRIEKKCRSISLAKTEEILGFLKEYIPQLYEEHWVKVWCEHANPPLAYLSKQVKSLKALEKIYKWNKPQYFLAILDALENLRDYSHWEEIRNDATDIIEVLQLQIDPDELSPHFYQRAVALRQKTLLTKDPTFIIKYLKYLEMVLNFEKTPYSLREEIENLLDQYQQHRFIRENLIHFLNEKIYPKLDKVELRVHLFDRANNKKLNPELRLNYLIRSCALGEKSALEALQIERVKYVNECLVLANIDEAIKSAYREMNIPYPDEAKEDEACLSISKYAKLKVDVEAEEDSPPYKSYTKANDFDDTRKPLNQYEHLILLLHSIFNEKNFRHDICINAFIKIIEENHAAPPSENNEAKANKASEKYEHSCKQTLSALSFLATTELSFFNSEIPLKVRSLLKKIRAIGTNANQFEDIERELVYLKTECLQNDLPKFTRV